MKRSHSKQFKNITKKSRSANKIKSKAKKIIKKHKTNRNITKKSKSNHKRSNRKQSGGSGCSLGYAMVKGMQVPAINNVDGEINFSNSYAKLNENASCNTESNNSLNHPVLKTF